jgi:hypothetical protein
MKRGKNHAFAIPHSSVFFEVAVLGNTTNAPTVPANGAFTAGASTFPIGANGISTVAAEAPTRTSAGIYVLTIAHLLANIIPINIEVTSAGASPTVALYGIIASIVPATRLITIRIYTPAGTLTDLGVNDMAVLSLKGYDTNSPA